jgi:hypothetical protein
MGRALETQNDAVRVCSPMIADMHHSDEEQNPDPDPHDRMKVKDGSGSTLK